MTSNNKEKIKIKLTNQGSETRLYLVSMDTPFIKIKNSFSRLTNEPPYSLRFAFDGKRIKDYDTPRSLEMENEDEVDVFFECSSG